MNKDRGSALLAKSTETKHTIKYLLFVALLTAPSMASAASIFTADVTTSFMSAAACSVGPTNLLADPTHPGSVGITCGDVAAVASAGAASNVGHVGAFANASTIGQGLSTSQGDATWQADFLVTSNSGATVANVSLNFAVGANLGGLGADLSESDFGFGIALTGPGAAGGPQNLFDLNATHSTQGDTCTSIPAGFCGTLLGNSVTPTFNVFVNVPFSLTFSVSVDVVAMGDDASGSVDASHSLDLILNQPVFNFSAPGFTANGDFIVDNIFVGPGLKRGRSQLTSQ